ncbi:MAG TPA: HAMP domain-containing sensor histidine kinase [Lentimicrobium sp.]|nr:HAMP domain-containing sensor histidine kinase [Lentimicrobium sp.]
MRKSTIAVIISFAGLALIGILIIQVYWMRNAMRLQEELFDKNVSVTLKSVVNRMFDERSVEGMETYVCGPACDHRTMQVLAAINPERLDSLMKEEFGGQEITKQYVWGVFDPASGNFFAGEKGNHKKDILNSNHHVSLSCLYRSEQLMLGVYFPNETGVLLSRILPWMVLSLLLVLIVVFAFSYMIFSFIKQKKLSEIKSDFVNNMTHELKTPISTISLASEMLLNPKTNGQDEKTQKYARMIFDENERLKQQVDQVLQIAVLEKGSFKLEISTFNAHELISDCIARFELALKSTGGVINFYPGAADYFIGADKSHFQTIVCNLLDNAVKYSIENPVITVSTRNESGMFVMSFQDKGIGISHDNQKMIFDKLYRVPKGNKHDVKGFGIGLYYVKTITEALKGQVKVKSELNKGSVFEIYLPINITVTAHA